MVRKLEPPLSESSEGHDHGEFSAFVLTPPVRCDKSYSSSLGPSRLYALRNHFATAGISRCRAIVIVQHPAEPLVAQRALSQNQDQ
jgi:hypothetical protein